MKKVRLAVYDFDGTLVPFETQSKILFYAVRKNPLKILLLPYVIVVAILYYAKIVNELYMKSLVLKFLNSVVIESFWKENKKNVFPWVRQMFKQNKKDGKKVMVISASPENILRDIVFELGADYFIGTPVSKNGKKIVGKNCKGEQKVVYLNAWAKKNKVEVEVVSMF
ncbi:MAG: haloacid dehalogenase-like hydrolase [Rickettsiales bacterium]|jgi:phosphoserine phosphatase|nr:haloacid dehalogenase-like hydrolase [Rickettsiales bacterium]